MRDDDKIVSLCDIRIARKIIKKRQLYESIGADPKLAEMGANAYYSLETDNPKLLAKLYKVIDLFALNFGKAKEKNQILLLAEHHKVFNCPHCPLEGPKDYMKKYHMQNCRHREPLREVK